MSRSSSQSVTSERKSVSQQPSRVLLVCVYQTVILQLKNDQIFQKFHPFGPITKILIFQKGEVTKFFIEFTQTQFAVNAKSKLDGTKFFDNICKLSIYYSNFRNVDLRHESSHGADYLEIEEKQQMFVQSFDHLSKSQRERDYLDDEVLMQTFLPFGENTFVRSKTENPKNLYSEILKMKKEEESSMLEEQQVDKSIKFEIHSLLSESDSRNIGSQKALGTYLQSQRTNSTLEASKDISSLGSNCAISYDIKEWVPLRNIYNLFSNFGNIEAIIAKKEKVFIKFRSGYFAAVSMNYLAGLSFCGNHLNLKYCETQSQWEQKPFVYSESIYFDQTSDRFTSKRSITVNPPSETLHVSSIKKENCNESSLRRIFGQFGYVDRVKILVQSNQKNMALVRFSTMKQSFEAISELHNKMFGGRKMQISFTKSKL